MYVLSRPLVRLSRVALVVAGIDLATKAVADAILTSGPVELGRFLALSMVHNVTGAFGWSAGSYTWQLNLALTLCAMVFVFPVARDLAEIDDRSPTALGLIVGGALGNLASLVLPPAGVADFIGVRWQPGHTIVLNLADIAAYVGLAMIARTGGRIAMAIREQSRLSSRVRLGSAYVRKSEARGAPRVVRPVADAVINDWSKVVDLGVVLADAPDTARRNDGRPFPRPLGVFREHRAVRLVDNSLSRDGDVSGELGPG